MIIYTLSTKLRWGGRERGISTRVVRRPISLAYLSSFVDGLCARGLVEDRNETILVVVQHDFFHLLWAVECNVPQAEVGRMNLRVFGRIEQLLLFLKRESVTVCRICTGYYYGGP